MNKIKIEKIISLASGKKTKLSKNFDLISNQILDSFSIMILLSEIEKILKKKLNMKNFKIDQLRTINKIEKFIKKHAKNIK